jgi:hypothetical protein
MGATVNTSDSPSDVEVHEPGNDAANYPLCLIMARTYDSNLWHETRSV